MLSVFTLEYKQGFSNIRGPTDYLIMRSSQPVLFFFAEREIPFSQERETSFSPGMFKQAASFITLVLVPKTSCKTLSYVLLSTLQNHQDSDFFLETT